MQGAGKGTCLRFGMVDAVGSCDSTWQINAQCTSVQNVVPIETAYLGLFQRKTVINIPQCKRFKTSEMCYVPQRNKEELAITTINLDSGRYLSTRPLSDVDSHITQKLSCSFSIVVPVDHPWQASSSQRCISSLLCVSWFPFHPTLARRGLA